MKRMTIFLTIAALLLLGSAALAQSGGPEPPALYSVQQGTVSGGDYQLTNLSWQVSGEASGQDYRLLDAATDGLRGSGCCCTYVPCVLRGL